MRQIAFTALLLLGLMGTTAGTAYATTCPNGEICGTAGYNGNGNAMNDWNGGGNVYAYRNGVSNENFLDETINRCSGGTQVTSTCPFTNTGDDNALRGKFIVQIVYAGGNTAKCVGSSSPAGDANLVGCNNPSTGTGGGVDSVYVVAGNNTLVSVGCTNGNGGTWCQLEQGSASTTDFFQGFSNATEWANVAF
jgi:hypothetical protein